MKNLYLVIILMSLFLCTSLPLHVYAQTNEADTTRNYKLSEVKVSASKNGRFSDYSAPTMQMSTFDIVTNPAAMADIIGNMRVLPGVQTNDNDGRLIIQGGSPGESKFYINDLIVINPYHATSKNSAVRSRFTPDLFEGIALQSAGSNAEFGQALSGVVNLNTKGINLMEPKTDIAVSSVYAGITHIDRQPTYAWRASINYTNLLPYSKLFPDNYQWEKYYQQLSADFFLTKEFSPLTKMTMQLNAGSAGGEYIRYNVDSIRFDNNFREDYLYAQANVYHTFSTHWSLSAAANVVMDKLSATDVQLPGDKADDLTLFSHSKINLQYRTGALTNRTGVELICNPFEETYTSGQAYDLSVRNHLLAMYNDLKWFITKDLTLSAGLRGEYSFYLKSFNVAPRVYLAYRLQLGHVVSASLGEYFQLPDMNYLKYSAGLDFTSAKKATLTYSYTQRGKKFQVDAYYKKYDDVVTYTAGAYTPVMANGGEGRSYGADVFWKSYFKQLEYWISYSFNRTEKQYDHYSTPVAPSYVSQHVGNITLKYWIAPLKSLLGAACNISAGTPYYNTSAPYEKLGATPSHHRLDLSWSLLPKEWIIIHFGCQNVLGHENIYGYDYSAVTPGLRQAVTSPEKRFYFLGLFITLSRDKKLNQLKAL